MAKYEIEVHDDLLDRFLVTLHADRWHSQVQQIALQRRIPEPGQWGVVRDNAGFDWIRTGTTLTSSKEWRSTDHGTPVDWAEIDGPTLIRAGLDPDLILEDKP